MLAVTGGKGGCGKTTTALGLARTLARRGMEPLVLDADCDMPDVHHLAGIERAGGVDALARGAPLTRACQQAAAFPGVAVVTAGRPGRTGPALRATHDWEGPVLVDCPAGIGPDATRPLRHADAALVVSTDHPVSLDDSRRTITAARQLDATPAGVVLRAVSRHPAEAPDRVADCPVLAAVPEGADPLDASALSRAWSRVADRLLGETATGSKKRRDLADGNPTPGRNRADRRHRERRPGSDGHPRGRRDSSDDHHRTRESAGEDRGGTATRPDRHSRRPSPRPSSGL